MKHLLKVSYLYILCLNHRMFQVWRGLLRSSCSTLLLKLGHPDEVSEEHVVRAWKDCWHKTFRGCVCVWGEGAGQGQVRPCPVLHTPLPRPVSQPDSGHQPTVLHTCLWSPHLAPEWPDEWKSRLGEGLRKAKGYLTHEVRQVHVLTLLLFGISISWTLPGLGVVAILVLFYVFSLFLLLIPSSQRFE